MTSERTIDGFGPGSGMVRPETRHPKVSGMTERDVSGTRSYLHVLSRRGLPSSDLADSWGRFHGYCEGLLRRSLAALGLPECEQDDCIQEVWGQILASELSHFRSGDLRAWVASLARNKAMDFYRRKTRRPVSTLDFDPVVSPSSPENFDEADQRCSTFWRVIAELEEQTTVESFLVFFLRGMEGWPIVEVAALLGLSTAQARLRDCRVKKKFRALWDRSQAGATPETPRGPPRTGPAPKALEQNSMA